MCHACNRRQFLEATAGGGILLAGAAPGAIGSEVGRATNPSYKPPEPSPVKIHVAYVGVPHTAWPRPDLDLKAERELFEKRLAEVEKKLAGVRLVGRELVGTPAEAAAVAAKLKDADGLLIVHLTLGTGNLLSQLVDAGRPTVIFAQPFSGHEWMFVPQWQKAGKRVVLLATSDYGELAAGVALLRTPAMMRQSRVLLIGAPAGTPAACSAAEIKKRLGAELVPIAVQRVIEAHKAVDPQAAEADARRWTSEAKKVVEPPPAEILKAARTYLAMKKLMEEERAQAITIRCLGGMPIDVLGYPCLGFARLNDLGLVGACEADVDSTLTMLLFTYAFGVPGFISDPLFDTAKNAVIHAHCSAPTKMDGPTGKAAPYLIRTHRDDNRGASLEVEMRVGQPITCAKLVHLDTMLISTGKIIEITDFDDRGCRTQITTAVRDAHRMLANWGGGVLKADMMTLLHRVVFYGDHLQDVRHLALLMGLKVVEEG